MKISEAKKWIKLQRLLASAIMLVTALLFASAALKSIYVAMGGVTTALSPLTQVVPASVL